jgi:hypothetical protein
MASSWGPSKEQKKATANLHFHPPEKAEATRSASEVSEAALRVKTEGLRALRMARDEAEKAGSETGGAKPRTRKKRC